ncbi:MAG: hypothetical protein KU38_05580 [Sulfurovum sp. FS08-3]|nr:MAG: hypothetical protein KU38_05580 [Sulfurovum sp. FS08-3]
MQESKTDIVNYFKIHSPHLKEKYHIASLSLFGSYARDEQRDDSDVDLLVDFEQTPDLLTFIELEEHLSHSLNKNVDLVIKRKLKSQLKEQILKEAIAI